MSGNDKFRELVAIANTTACDAVELRDALLRYQKDYLEDEGRLYQIQFPYFFRAMLKEMDKHYPEKGDFYHECEVEYMEKILYEALDAYKRLDWDHPRKATQTIDIANICAMLYQRLCGI